MQQTFSLSKTNYLFLDENEELESQNWLDRLAEKKTGWEVFLQKVREPLASSRLNASKDGRTLLHLAILDNQLEMVKNLSHDPTLKLRRDSFGLSPLELAQLLDRKECLHLLQQSSPALPEVPDLAQFEYLSHPVFETIEGLEKVLHQAAKAKKGDKISAEKIWMGIYFDKEIRMGLHPPISIRHVDREVGYGVFAEKKIPACTYVGEYTGVIQERNPRQLKDKRYCLRYTIWEGKQNFCIDAEHRGNFTRFLNHSEKPNLSLQSIYWRSLPRMIFVTLKEIREGGQLTFDYGPLFWKESPQRQKLLDDF